MAALALGQDASWDLKNYHLYNPYAWLQGRNGFDYLPAQLQTYYNPLLDLPFYAAHRAFAPPAAALAVAALQGATFWVLCALGRRLLMAGQWRHPGTWAMVAAALGCLGAGSLSEMGTSFGDNLVSILVLSGLLLLLRPVAPLPACDGAPAASAKHLAGAGIIVGAAAGLKPTAGVFGLALVIAALFSDNAARWAVRRAAGVAVAAAAGFALTGGVWAVSLYRRTGNPLFPYLNGLFCSPYAPCRELADRRYLPRDAHQWLFYPYYLATGNELADDVLFADPRLAIVWSLLLAAAGIAMAARLARLLGRPLANLCLARTSGLARASWRALLAFWVSGYGLWLLAFANYRYAMPLELLAGLVALGLLGALPLGGRGRLVLAAALAATAAAGTQLPDRGRTHWSGSLTGVEFPDLGDGGSPPIIVIASWDPVGYAFTAAPAQARVVRLFSNLCHPRCAPALEAEMRAVLARHAGPIWLLSTWANEGREREVLGQFGLSPRHDVCRPLPSKLDRGLRLCPVAPRTVVHGEPGAAVSVKEALPRSAPQDGS